MQAPARTRSMAALLFLFAILTGCVPSFKPAEPPAPAEPITIRLATFSLPVDDTMDLLIAAFHEATPGYRVERVRFDPEGPIDAFVATVAEGGVDVAPAHLLEPRQQTTSLLPLDRFLARGDLDPALYGPLLDDLRIGGQVMALPYGIQPGLLLYNTNLTRAYEVDIPQDAWTWDEFRTALRNLTSGQGVGRIWGLETEYQDELVRARLEAETGRPAWEAGPQALRDVLSYFGALSFDDQSLTPAPRAAIEENSIRLHYTREPLKALNERTTAMTYERAGIDAHFLMFFMRVPWDVAPMPSAPGTRPVVPVMPQTMGIPAKSERAEAAWKFVAFAGGPAGAEVLARGGHLPALNTESARKAWDQHRLVFPPGLDSIWNATWRYDLGKRSASGVMTKRQLELTKAINWALSGEKSVEDALDYFTSRKTY